ncbi:MULTISPECIES: nitroreductase family protein [unclassified Sporolactobacillus]|uniref:nitroreductase family protein n=1 Tax=unclassified Sporolactobacillus TaxID=2628533 RepID=UPI0023681173|nr:nitroreductase family protein [Sporolactobacillus sp. CQH2019]MDD9149911.1 nitroreductase family protein [Sporolactobacillus sp. CQH2019]
MNEEAIRLITGRKSIRKYDEAQKISRDEMTRMLEEACRAPSALNLQPWRFLVIQSHEGKEKLKPLFYNNPLLLDSCSAMIAVLGDFAASDYKDQIYDKAVTGGTMSKEERDKEVRLISDLYDGMPHDEQLTDVSFNSALAAMQLMLVARAHGYETCPLGGFDKKRFSEVFDYDRSRYLPLVLIAIGKPAEEGFDTVRLGVDEITKWI